MYLYNWITMLYTWNTQHWRSTILHLNWKKKKKGSCLYVSSEVSKYSGGNSFTGCLCCCDLHHHFHGHNLTLLSYFHLPGPLYKPHCCLLPVPPFQYLLSWTSKKRFDQVSLLLMNLHKLCKVYWLKPSFLNLEAVKGSKPFFFFFSDCSFSISFIDLDQIRCLDTLPEFRLIIPLPPVWKDDWP